MNLRDVIERYVPGCEQEAQDRRMMLKYMDTFDDTLLRTNETAHFTASAWVVNPARDRLLMVYHNIYNSWSWTGGHADGEEDLLSVALREVMEETGLENVKAVTDEVFSLEILTVDAHFKKGKYVVPHLHLNLTYLIEADEAQLLKIKPDENSGVKWFAPDEAVEASTEPEMQVIYRKLNEKLFALRK
ncbi:MAG: NUDIX hydrolase [Clostridia bacterium]|nr:NUDIX hydrolase [Clostridia bacterium]